VAIIYLMQRHGQLVLVVVPRLCVHVLEIEDEVREVARDRVEVPQVAVVGEMVDHELVVGVLLRRQVNLPK
jgi:hypothetical protein